jgi:hypothetical protein
LAAQTHDFGQIQNSVDQDSGRNTTTVGVFCVHVVQKEIQKLGYLFPSTAAKFPIFK